MGRARGNLGNTQKNAFFLGKPSLSLKGVLLSLIAFSFKFLRFGNKICLSLNQSFLDYGIVRFLFAFLFFFLFFFEICLP